MGIKEDLEGNTWVDHTMTGESPDTPPHRMEETDLVGTRVTYQSNQIAEIEWGVITKRVSAGNYHVLFDGDQYAKSCYPSDLTIIEDSQGEKK